MKTHWLFGIGPDKRLEFNKEVDVETDCRKCIHQEVCDFNMEKRCTNYKFGSSEGRSGCGQCSHRYTRFDKDETKVPCFTCKWFEEKK